MIQSTNSVIYILAWLFPLQVLAQFEKAPAPTNTVYTTLPSFPEELYNLRPSTTLPNTQLNEQQVVITNRLDTFQIHFKFHFDHVDSSKVFMFSLKESPNTNFKLAVNRGTSWLILDANLFRRLTTNSAHFSFPTFKGINAPLLKVDISIPADKQVNRRSNRSVDSWWKKVSITTLINLETFEFYLHNLYTGYEYSYIEKSIEGTDKIQFIKTALLKYDLDFNPKKCQLSISESENHHIIQTKVNEEAAIEKGFIKNACSPIQQIGLYKLKENKFVRKN